MKKIVIFLLLLLTPCFVYALDVPTIYSESAMVYDATMDETVIAKDQFKQIQIASLTKVLTVITALDNIENVNDTVTITYEMLSTVESDLALAGLKEGDTVTYLDLMYAAILPSGADATHALAYSVGGSLSGFADLMNAEATKIGCTQSHFVNPSGATAEGHYSSAYDQILILKYAMQNDTFKTVFQTNSKTLTNGLVVNGPLNGYDKAVTTPNATVTGVKTGYTSAAGYTAITSVEMDEHVFYIVVLNSYPTQASGSLNMTDTATLVEYLSEHYRGYNIAKKGDVITTINVKLATITKLDIKLKQNINFYFPEDYDSTLVNIDYSGLDEITPENKIGDFLGVVNVYYNSTLIYTENIYLNQEIGYSIAQQALKSTPFAILKVSLFILVGFFILVLILKIKKKRRIKKRKINRDELNYLKEKLYYNHGLMTGIVKGKKRNYRIIKLDENKMEVTLKRLK